MKTTIIEDLDTLDLPIDIINSLRDKQEMAHIRKLNDVIYIILNYPSESHSLQSLCVKYIEGDYFLFLPEGPAFHLDQQDSFPHLVLAILARYEYLVDALYDDIHALEDRLETLSDKVVTEELFTMKKEVIRYNSAIRALKNVLTLIQSEKPEGFYIDTQSYDYASIRVEVYQLLDNIEVCHDFVDTLFQISEYVHSTDLNQTIKRLTGIALLISIPAFITSFYELNELLPFPTHPLFVPSLGFTSVSIFLYVALSLKRSK